jgi:hypothetical protein
MKLIYVKVSLSSYKSDIYIYIYICVCVCVCVCSCMRVCVIICNRFLRMQNISILKQALRIEKTYRPLNS